MDIDILEEFVSLVETESFQETAYKKNISQSALTKHIQKLESELGVSLFDRSVRSIQTNKFGKSFYPYAEEIVSKEQEALSSLQALSNDEKNIFSVAYAPLLGQYGLIDLLTTFSKENPYSDMRMIETYQPFNLLKSRKCEFAFLGENEIDAGDNSFNKMIFKKDHLAVIVPKNHKFADRKEISLKELKDESFILHSSATNIPQEETQKFLDLCKNEGITPKVAAESHFTSTIVHYVEGGSGIAVLNRMHIPSEAKDTCVILDITPRVDSYIYLLYRNKLSCPAALDFLHFIIEKIEDEVS